jgi:hypothetical protein
MNRKIDSLYGVLRVQRVETPPSVVFVIIPVGSPREHNGVKTVDIEMESYVRMAALPAKLRAEIRAAIPTPIREKVLEGMSEETRNEALRASGLTSLVEVDQG